MVLRGGGAGGGSLDIAQRLVDRMPDDVLAIRVECYAGHRGEETPRRLWIGERLVTIAGVRDRWLAPDHRYFKVAGDDGAVYIIRFDTTADRWELTMFQRAERASSVPDCEIRQGDQGSFGEE
jgi:hypothetical protein